MMAALLVAAGEFLLFGKLKRVIPENGLLSKSGNTYKNNMQEGTAPKQSLHEINLNNLLQKIKGCIIRFHLIHMFYQYRHVRTKLTDM